MEDEEEEITRLGPNHPPPLPIICLESCVFGGRQLVQAVGASVWWVGVEQKWVWIRVEQTQGGERNPYLRVCDNGMQFKLMAQLGANMGFTITEEKNAHLLELHWNIREDYVNIGYLPASDVMFAQILIVNNQTVDNLSHKQHNNVDSGVFGTVALSISSNGISNRNRILLNESQAVWQVNKMMKIGYKGSDEEVVSKIMEMEKEDDDRATLLAAKSNA
ncbi:hypothetical protein RHGRI_017210 [Rhododendron griersonianum]|uniref:Uncharacterized protein n=1 Tax=Rhododendron griersonianum TaxID=479676 RepID=A0AAV6JWX3_9ERIC|nr:hypothetical protein RHGRI_017210 [Rhododendron griersonianum]